MGARQVQHHLLAQQHQQQQKQQHFLLQQHYETLQQMGNSGRIATTAGRCQVNVDDDESSDKDEVGSSFDEHPPVSTDLPLYSEGDYKPSFLHTTAHRMAILACQDQFPASALSSAFPASAFSSVAS